MKNGNLLLLALLILMSNLSLSAQEVYYPGFIVLKNDKKLDGLITEKQNDINFNIVYKDVATGEEIVYTAAEVAYFYYSAGEKYITAPITLNDKVHFVFLKQLVGGEISLYSYVDQLSKEHFYMLNADNLLRDLKFSTVPYQYSKVDMIRPKALYLGELKLAMVECETINDAIENTKLNRQALIDIFVKYYQCTSKPYELYQTKSTVKRDRFDIGINIGTNHLVIRTPQDVYITPQGVQYGINLDYYLPISENRYSVGIGYRRAAYGYNNSFYQGRAVNVNLKRYFTFGRHRLYPEGRLDYPILNKVVLPRIGVLGSIGYDFKIYKFRFFAETSYRFMRSQAIYFNFGVKI